VSLSHDGSSAGTGRSTRSIAAAARREDESVLPLTLRGAVARARETLLELAERLPDTVGPLELPDADESYIDLYRRALHRDEHA
jgi:hypothetical protein